MVVGIALEFVAVFVGYSISADAGNLKEFNGIISVQILSPISHGTLVAGSTRVIIGCACLRHDTKVVRVRTTAAFFGRPEGAACIFGNLLILLGDVRAPFCSYGFRSFIIFIIIIIIILECQCFLNAVIVHIDHAGAVGGNGNGV